MSESVRRRSVGGSQKRFTGPCAVAGCDMPYHAKGLCRKHYSADYDRKRKDGTYGPLTTRTCPECGEQFEPVNRRHQVCSRPCRRKVAYREAAERYGGYRNVKLRYRYGITGEQYEAILAAQGGVCAICKGPPGARGWHVDHDHACCSGKGYSCGKCVRGLLCWKCNSFIGLACDDIVRLQNAIEYLGGGGKWPHRRTTRSRFGAPTSI